MVTGPAGHKAHSAALPTPVSAGSGSKGLLSIPIAPRQAQGGPERTKGRDTPGGQNSIYHLPRSRVGRDAGSRKDPTWHMGAPVTVRDSSSRATLQITSR